jgi:hypothetical protein
VPTFAIDDEQYRQEFDHISAVRARVRYVLRMVGGGL